MIINKEGLVKLLKALDGASTDNDGFTVYSMVADLVYHEGTPYDEREINQITDEILDYCGAIEDDDMAEEMTLFDIERELGKKIRIV